MSVSTLRQFPDLYESIQILRNKIWSFNVVLFIIVLGLHSKEISILQSYLHHLF